jgi:serine/threonine protein kinase
MAEQTTNVGTPVYMAPELMTDDAHIGKYDGSQVDVYSFGILMWAVLTRSKPYETSVASEHLNVWALRDLIIGGCRPDRQEDGELDVVPGSVVKLMVQCWEETPSKRPSGFDEIHRVLKKVCERVKVYGFAHGSGTRTLNHFMSRIEIPRPRSFGWRTVKHQLFRVGAFKGGDAAAAAADAGAGASPHVPRVFKTKNPILGDLDPLAHSSPAVSPAPSQMTKHKNATGSALNSTV